MKISAFVGASVLALGPLNVALAGCGNGDDSTHVPPPASSTSDSSAMKKSGATSSRSGSFEGLNGHAVAGKVVVAGDRVTLSGFSCDKASDLHLYLAKGHAAKDVPAGADLGTLDAAKVSQAFSLKGIDADAYDTVLVAGDEGAEVLGAAAVL